MDKTDLRLRQGSRPSRPKISYETLTNLDQTVKIGQTEQTQVQTLGQTEQTLVQTVGKTKHPSSDPGPE